MRRAANERGDREAAVGASVSRASLAVALFTGAAFALALAADTASKTILPTEWSLSPPAGIVVRTGTLPESATLTADGRHLVVLEGGQGGAAIRVLEPDTLATQRVVSVHGAYGMPLADLTGDGFWFSTAQGDSIVHMRAATGTADGSFALPKGFWGAAIARSSDGHTLAVSGDLAKALVFADERTRSVSAPIAVGRHPAGIAFSSDGKMLFVANWAESTLSVIDVAAHSVRASITVGKHPEALLLSRDGRRLYASVTDDDAIAIIDVATLRRVESVNVGLYGTVDLATTGAERREQLYGASPAALVLSPDGSRLYVACSAANAIAVLKVGGSQPEVLGAIPTGWYPTALALTLDGRALDVVDGKGEGQRANPEFNPFGPRAMRFRGYVASNTFGSVRRVPLPDGGSLSAGLQTVRADAGRNLRGPFGHTPFHDEFRFDPGWVVSKGGPIRHVIYVIKENRTYDQVLGDLPGADGDPKLTLFGRDITPNEHAIAQRFGIFDNAFANAQVSADGHNWSMAAFANDYLEKMWPQNYGGRRELYDFEDGATASVPHNGYLWNAAARAGISMRNYGEFTTAPDGPGGRVTTRMPALGAVTDPRFVGWDISYRDEAREAEWRREFDAYVKNGNLPALEIIRLPNDHTAGTRPGARTPQAFVAENDLAFGRLVDAVSHSPYWKDTAIFAVEDDAQNGPDHVSAERMPIYVVSAYARGGVNHGDYSTAGIVATIESILGLPPMSAYDASANDVEEAFIAKRDLRPYDALPEAVDLEAKNGAAAYRARESARLDFTREDAAPDATLNDIVWHAVRGADSTPPPYGAFAQ